MTEKLADPSHCQFCGSEEYEHLERGDSCIRRLVKQRNRAISLAWGIAIGALFNWIAQFIWLYR